MIWWIYNLLFPLAFAFLIPHFLFRMARRGGYARHFSQRFARYAPAESALLDAPDRPIWIQAVSVGELAIAFSFMDELRRQDPSLRFVLTTNTSTGHALALAKVKAPDATLYFPMDVPWIVRRALRRLRPRAIVLIENELWPNLIRSARKMQIPTILVNGRISEHSFKGYKKIIFFTRRLLPEVQWFCVQTPGDRDRLLTLGAPAERLEVVGSAKYDIEATPHAIQTRARAVLTALGVQPGDPVWVGGSTWSGEEDALLSAAVAAHPQHPRLLLVLVPRHAERREEVLAAIRSHGLSVVQLSQFSPDTAASAPIERPQVLLVDTTGELRGFYAVADLVFVGKSLTQLGGQNPIEPARDGKAILVGPHMENFPVIANDFQQASAWVQVADASELTATALRLLGSAPEREKLGRAAFELVAQQAGATALMARRVLDAAQKS